MEENYLKGGIWHLYWASGRKDSTLSDILHEKECYYKLHFPFLQPKQHTAKAYDELEIPHVCGVIDRARLHKMYLEMRKKDVPVKILKSKSFSRMPKCFSVKKKSLPKSFELKPSKVTSVNERPPSSKPSLTQVEKTNSLKSRKSVTFQDGVCIINISPNRNKKKYPPNDVSLGTLNSDLLTPNNSLMFKEPSTNKSSQNNSYNKDQLNESRQNTLDNMDKSHAKNEISSLAENMKTNLSCVTSEDSFSGFTNKVLEINQNELSDPSLSGDNRTENSKLIRKPQINFKIPREGKGCHNSKHTSNKRDQSNQENGCKPDTKKVLFLHSLSLTECSLEEANNVEENKDNHPTDLPEYGNINHPCHTNSKKIPKAKKTIKNKRMRKAKRASKNFAESPPSLPNSKSYEAKGKYNDREQIILRKKDISTKSKEQSFSLEIEYSQNSESELSLSFNNLNIASYEENSMLHNFKHHPLNDRSSGVQEQLEKYNLNAKQNEGKTQVNIFNRSGGKDMKEDQLDKGINPNCLAQLGLSTFDTNLNLKPSIENDVISPSSSQQIFSQSIKEEQPLSLEMDALQPLQIIKESDYLDVESKNQEQYQDPSNDTILSLNDVQPVEELERVPHHKAQLAEESEEQNTFSPEIQDVHSYESQVQLSAETKNSSESPGSKETEVLTSCFANSNTNNLHYLKESKIARYRDTDESSIESHYYSPDSSQDVYMEEDSIVNNDSENLSFLNKATEHLNIKDIDFPSSIRDKCSEFSTEIINHVLFQEDNEQIKLNLKKYNSSVDNSALRKARSSIVSLNISLKNFIEKRKNLKFSVPSKNNEKKSKDNEKLSLENITNAHTSEENSSSSSESIILSPTDKEIILANQESPEEVSTAYETEKETGKLKISRFTQNIKSLSHKKNENISSLTLGHLNIVNAIPNKELSNTCDQNIKIEKEEARSLSNLDVINNSPARDVCRHHLSRENCFKSSVSNSVQENMYETSYTGSRKDDRSDDVSCNSSPIENNFNQSNAVINHQLHSLIKNKAEVNDKLVLENIINHGHSKDNFKSSSSEQIILEKLDNNLVQQSQFSEKEATPEIEFISPDLKCLKLGSTEGSNIKIQEKNTIIDEKNAIFKHSVNINSTMPSPTTEHNLNSKHSLESKNELSSFPFEHDHNAKSESILSASFSEGMKISENKKNFNLNWTLPRSSIASTNLVLESETLGNKVELSDHSCKQKSSVSIIDSSDPLTNNKLESVLDKLLKQKHPNRSNSPNNQSEECKDIKTVKTERKIEPDNTFSTITKSNILEHADNSQLSIPLTSNSVDESMSLFNRTEIKSNYFQLENSKSYAYKKRTIKKEIIELLSDRQQSLSTVDSSKRSPIILSSNIKSHKKKINHFIRKKRAKLIKTQPLVNENLSSSEEERIVYKKPPKPWRRHTTQLNFQNEPKPVHFEHDIPNIGCHEHYERKSEDNEPEIKEIDIKEFSPLKEPIGVFRKQEYSAELYTSSKNSDDCRISEEDYLLNTATVDQNRFKSIKNKSRILASDVFSSEENKSSQKIKTKLTKCTDPENTNNSGKDNLMDNYQTHECKNFQEKKSPQNDHSSKSTSMREALKFEKWYRSRWVQDSYSTKSNLNVNINNENELSITLSDDARKSKELLKRKMNEVPLYSPKKQCQSVLHQPENYLSKYFQPEDIKCNVSSENFQPLTEISNFQETFFDSNTKAENKTTEKTNLDSMKENSENTSFTKSHIISKMINLPCPNDITFNEKNVIMLGKRKSAVAKHNAKQLKFSSPEKLILDQNLEHSARKRCSTSRPINKFKNETLDFCNNLKEENNLDLDEIYQPETKKYMKSSIVRWMDMSACDSPQGSNSPEKETLLRRTFFMGSQR